MNYQINYQEENQFLARNQLMSIAILIVMFLTAVGIRVYGITNIPMNYHPVKQYRSALTARAMYYSKLVDITDLDKQTAIASLEYIGYLGPPVVDFIAASAYLIYGSEALWLPKLFSVIYWTIGGIFLYFIARRMMNFDAAIISTAIYLLLPFGVLSSQSFQPDPLMIMFMIISLYLIIIFHSEPTTKKLFFAAFISAASILIKPVSLFIIFGAYLGLQIHYRGLNRNLLRDRYLVIFSLITVIPTALYYGFGMIYTTTLDQQAQKSFLPQLLIQFNYWDGWLKRIKIAVGFDVFIGSMLSMFIFPNSWQKKFVFGMWGGYIVMCLVFSYTISTHDYYHLPLFPIAALSFGPTVTMFFYKLRQQTNMWYMELGVWIILIVALFLSAGVTVQAVQRLPDYHNETLTAGDIGEAVSHSTRTIMLAPYDGKPLMYYGKLAGKHWPYWYDIRDEKLWDVKDMLPAERMGMLATDMNPEFFIVTDIEELENQKDLKEYLDETYPVFAHKPEYIIYQINP
jgi:hypothetical protein